MSRETAMCAANFNALAKLISNAGFRRLILDDNYKQYAKQMKCLLKRNGVQIPDKCSLSEVINISYEHLLLNYRHEYLYKSALLNSYVLENHCLSDTILLNEFKVGNSKADVVVVNGTNKVFEIKTELDSPERLTTQVKDYYKAFSEVYLIVHHSLVTKYLKIIDNYVGVMSFSPFGDLVLEYKATPNEEMLEVTAMLKSLRKAEYLNIIKNLTGSIPNVQPVQLFNTCLEIANSFNAKVVQTEFLKVIKNRINNNVNGFTINNLTPWQVRFSCYNANLTQKEYLSLIKRLNYQF